MASFLTKIKDFYINKKGFHTDRKLVVFESDDWGSIRMPSKGVLDELKELGDSAETNAYLRNDCLETESDLIALFDVLGSVSDKNGNSPVFTMNFAMANPNFEKIDYKNGIYEYEPFYDTYFKYYGKNNILDLIKEGYSKKLILPQLHCREHLNVGRWLRDLKDEKDDTLLAFKYKTMGIGASFHQLNQFGYMDSFNNACSSDIELDEILLDANKMFYDVFGYKSLTFVASCFVWSDSFEKSLKNQGINYIQSGCWQYKPVGKRGEYKFKRVLRYTGQKNKLNQIYSVRNCYFEPAYNQNAQECVQTCLYEVEKAFKSRKPAIINTHRLNYIGSINPLNRENNLLGLKDLLNTLITKYPDIEFVSSAELFSIMEQVKK